MCANCANPESFEGKTVRDYLRSCGKKFTEAYVIAKSRKLKLLTEPSVMNNAAFNADTDSMPDGIHAKPYKYWASVTAAIRHRRANDDIQAERHANKLKRKYDLLPDPKPPFFDWAASQPKTQFLVFTSLLRNAMAARSIGDQTKAGNAMLDHGKAKPKQAIEVTQGITGGEASELFRQLAQMSGIPAEAIETFIASYIGQPGSTN